MRTRTLVLSTLGLFCTSALAGAAPKVAKTIPTAGATDVDPRLSEITILFDTPIKMNSWSFVVSDKGKFPELVGDTPITFPNNKTCVVKVKLAPDTAYAIGINSPTRQGFKAAGDGTPAAPSVLAFKTGSGKPKIAPDAPRVVKTDPADGTTDLQAGTYDLTIVFSEPMAKGKAAVNTPPEGPRLKLIGKPRWADARTFVVPIMLAKAQTVRIGINTGGASKFVSAGDGTAALPYGFTFSTRGAEATKQPPPADTASEPEAAGKGSVKLRYDYRKGDAGRVMQRNVVDIKLKLSSGQTWPLVRKSGINAIEEVEGVQDGKPVVVNKMISEYLLLASNEQTGELEAAPKLDGGLQVRVDRRSDTPRVDTLKGQAPEALLGLLGEDYFPDVVVSRQVQVGETFGLPAETLDYLRAEFGSTPSDPVDVKLTCRRIGPKPVADARNAMLKSQGKKPVVYTMNVAEMDVAWKQDGRLPNGSGFTLDAKGELVFAVDAGVLLRFAVEGTFSVKPFAMQDENGQQIQVSGGGDYAFKYDYEPIAWQRGVISTSSDEPPGTAEKPKSTPVVQDKPSVQDAPQARNNQPPSKADEAWEQFHTDALTSPKGTIVHAYNMLSAGSTQDVKRCFTAKIRDQITDELVKKAQKSIQETDLGELVARVLVDDDKGLCKIIMKNGRTLTWLVRENDKWYCDTLWFK